MSLKTWKAEFYPEPASKGKKWGAQKAVEHSLRKWIGLRESNLQKHGCRISNSYLCSNDDDDSLFIGSDSCALCVKYLDHDAFDQPCLRCPLFKVRGDVPCDDVRREEMHNPYVLGTLHGTPEPMIHWLRRARKYVETKARKA